MLIANLQWLILRINLHVTKFKIVNILHIYCLYDKTSWHEWEILLFLWGYFRLVSFQSNMLNSCHKTSLEILSSRATMLFALVSYTVSLGGNPSKCSVNMYVGVCSTWATKIAECAIYVQICVYMYALPLASLKPAARLAEIKMADLC